MSSASRFIEFTSALREGKLDITYDKESTRFLVVTVPSGDTYKLDLRYLDRQAFIRMMIFADERSKK